jgi:geranylgeranyl diphosphate synthase type II
MNFEQYLEERRAWVEQALDDCLPRETEPPELLHRAMRYSVQSGGKRLRPILCLASAEAAGGTAESALRPALALECFHTYTLVHDDLPAMDNDDLRRGRPTTHKVFGESIAILAGDALHTFAFELLSQCPQAAALVAELARAAGTRGVAGGQCDDLQAEGLPPDPTLVRRIHERKTASLIEASCRMGGICAAAPPMTLEALGRYGRAIGLAFQIVDDILNVTSTPEQLGKATGSDATRKKMTWVSVFGLDESVRMARDLMTEALRHLEYLPGPTEALHQLAIHVVERSR